MRIDSETAPLRDPTRMFICEVFEELDNWSAKFPNLVLTCGPLRAILRRQKDSKFYDGGDAVRLTTRGEHSLLLMVRQQAPKQ